MPIAAGDFINSLALKAGIKPDNPELVGLLAAPGLAQIQIPDALVSTLEAGIISITDAQNNHPVIKRKYFADAHDGIDAQIHALALDPDVMEVVKGERSTAKKIALVVEKLKAAKPAGGAPDDKALTDLKAKVNDLQAKLEAAAKEKDGLVTTHTEQLQQMQVDIQVDTILAGYKTAFDELPPAARKAALKTLIAQNLQDSNAVLKVDDNGQLTLVGKDGTNVFGSDNRQYTPQSFLDKSVAPVLKNSGPQNPKPGFKPAVNPPNLPHNGAGQGQDNNAGIERISALNSQALSDFDKGSKAGMGQMFSN